MFRYFIKKLCATSWSVEDRAGNRIGVVNVPGNHPTKHCAACYEYEVLGAFETVEEAANAIVQKHLGDDRLVIAGEKA